MVKFNYHMAIKFAEWLENELNKRGWTQADLARRSGVTAAQVSRILSMTRGVGIEACQSFARALSIPIETVLREAGYIPPRPDVNQSVNEGVDYLRALNEQNLSIALSLLHTLHEQQEKYNTSH